MLTDTWNLPNSLTFLRILLTVPFAYLVWQGRFGTALIVFLIAGITDYADGYAARHMHQETSFGRLLDPIADKVLTTAAFVVLAWPRSGIPSIPIWLAGSVIGRDIIIVFGSLLVYLSVRFTQFKPSLAGKINTFLEIGLVTVFLAVQSLRFGCALLSAAYFIVLASVIISGVGYIMKGIGIYRTARAGTKESAVPPTA